MNADNKNPTFNRKRSVKPILNGCSKQTADMVLLSPIAIQMTDGLHSQQFNKRKNHIGNNDSMQTVIENTY